MKVTTQGGSSGMQRVLEDREVVGGRSSSSTSSRMSPTATSSTSEHGWEHDRGEERARLVDLVEKLARSYPKEAEALLLVQEGETFTNEELVMKLFAMISFCHPTLTTEYKLTPEQQRVNRRVLTLQDWEEVREAFVRGCELGFLVMDQEGFMAPKEEKKVPEASKGGSQASGSEQVQEASESGEGSQAAGAEQVQEAVKPAAPTPPPRPGSDVKWLTIGVLTGLIIHIDVQLWMTRDPEAQTLLKALPEDLASLLTRESGLTAVGIGIKRDLEMMGMDMQWIDAQRVFDDMVSRGALSHYHLNKPLSSMLALQCAMWGRYYHTKCFYGMQKFKNFFGKWWPFGRNKRLPKHRFLDEMCRWVDSNLTAEQWHYNAHDIFTVMALLHLKVVAVLLNNKEWPGGSFDRFLYEQALREDIEQPFISYGDPPSFTSNMRSNPCWPFMPNVAKKPGRRGPYLGVEMSAENFPDHDVPRFGTQAYEDLKEQQRLARMRMPGPYPGAVAVPADWGHDWGQDGACGQPVQVRPTASTTPPVTPTLSKREMKELDTERKLIRLQEELGIDLGVGPEPEDPYNLSAFDDYDDYEEEYEGYVAPPDSGKAAEKQVFLDDTTGPLMEPFYQYCVPARMSDLSDEEKWKWIRQQRKGEMRGWPRLN
jgi:hypothetical protein